MARKDDAAELPSGRGQRSAPLSDPVSVPAPPHAVPPEALRVRRLAEESGQVLLFRLRLEPRLAFDYVSPGVERLLGRRAEEFYADPQLPVRIAHPDDIESLLTRLREPATILDGATTRLLDRDGNTVWLHHVALGDYVEGRLVAIEAMAVDITARVRAERALTASEARFRRLVQESSDMLLLYDDSGVVTYASPASGRTLGYRVDELVGGSVLRLVHPADAATVAELVRGIEGGHPYRKRALDFRALTASGATKWVHAVVTDLRADPAVGAFVVNAYDVTAQRELASRLWTLAHHDPMTGVPNRTLLVEWLDEQLRTAAVVGVLALELDDVDLVSQSAGFEAGDAALRRVVARAQALLGTTGIVGRLDGARLAACRVDLDEAAAQRLAHELLDIIGLPVRWGAAEFQLSASIGISVSVAGDSATPLLHRAGSAAMHARRRGRGVVEVYRPSLRDEVLARVATAGDLRRALAADELFALYQPVVSLDDGRIVGAEALARWRHPDRGIVLPGEFIPVAEDTGLVGDIGMHVLADAARQARRWNGLSVGVNVSVHQLASARSAARLQEASRDFLRAGGRLTLEITETALLDDDELVVRRLLRLHEEGVQLALDDFGTLYSSLTYLRRYPFTMVKVDRSFVQGIADDARDRSIVGSVVALAGALGLGVVAEGVETRPQLHWLRGLHCDCAQGFLLGRPMPAADLDRLLADGAELRALVDASVVGPAG